MYRMIFLLLLAPLFSCGNGADTNTAADPEAPSMEDGMSATDMSTTADFTDGTWSAATTDYLALKDALVASDLSAAKSAAAQMRTELMEADMMAMAEGHDAYMRHHNMLVPALERVEAASDLSAARAAFEQLTEPMVAAVADLGRGASELYLQHCPMEFDNAGANWLSDEREIRNPYFGDAMLTCGRVVETL